MIGNLSGFAVSMGALPLFQIIPAQSFAAALPFIGLGLMTCVLVVALSYMLSEFFRLPELKAWTKNEMYELWINGIIIAMIGVAVVLFDTLASAAIGLGPGATPLSFYNFAEMYLETMFTRLMGAYTSMIAFEVIIGFLSTLGMSILFPELALFGLNLGVSPFSGLMVISNAQIMLADTVGMALASIIMQQALLDFIKATMLKYFLPLGLVLRAFPVSRKTGSTIIALAIAAYFIYPMTLILNSYMLDRIDPQGIYEFKPLSVLCSKDGNQVAQELDDVKNAYIGAAQGEGTGNWWETVLPNMTNFSKVLLASWELLKVMLNGIIHVLSLDFRFFIYSAFRWLISEIIPVVQFTSMAIMFPVIDIIITITLFRDISETLGGERDILGVSKII